MMEGIGKKLRGVIFGIDHVLITSKGWDSDLFDQIEFLIQYILSKGLTPVILANRDWLVNGTDIQNFIDKKWAKIPWFIANRDRFPQKPKASSIQYVLEQMGWDSTEVIYVGSTEADMRTAVNGKVLFLNATWYGKNTDYGIKVSTPKEVGRFIDTFCLRDHLWHFVIQDENLKFYALAPYSTYKPEYEAYSTDAKNAAKWGLGHPEFWTSYLWSSIYFSGLHKQIDFVATYPGHEADSINHVMEVPMLSFSKCFRIGYLKNLIHRHTTATKSAAARAKGIHIDHANQLNTIEITKLPMKPYGNESYKKCPLISGKTVLVVDDICTRGYSLEAARLYLMQRGINVIGVSWLKTINTDYESLYSVNIPDPFIPNLSTTYQRGKVYPYRDHVVDPLAPEEIDTKLRSYDQWDWP